MVKTTTDLEWQRINAREVIGKEFELLFPSMLQRLFEMTSTIDALKQELNHEPTSKEVAQNWEKRVDQSNMSEKVSPTYVDCVMVLRKRVLGDKNVLQMLLNIDDDMGKDNPWQSAYTLEVVAKKVGAHGCAERTVWIIAAINHEAREGTLARENMSFRSFSGKHQPSNKGYCDLVLYKLDLLDHMLRQELPRLCIPADEVKLICDALSNHEAHRATLLKGKAWIGIMTETGQNFYTMTASMVYSCGAG